MLWQLVYLGTTKCGYMLVAYENPKSAQAATKTTIVINMENNFGHKKQTECSNINKSG